MSAHLGWDELVDYWMDEHPDADAIEAHVMGCSTCTQLSARVVALTRALGTLLPPLVTPGTLAKLAGRGLRVSESVWHPGDRREVVFPADLDVLIHRLEGLPADATRLDFTMFAESTRVLMRRSFASNSRPNTFLTIWKMSRFTPRTHSDPPRVPVYSYHCTHSGCVANTFPRVSQGQEMSQFRCRYSNPIQ